MRILITGGAGFIGSEFVHQVIDSQRYEVSVIDSLSYAGRIRNISSVESSIDFTKLDIRDTPALETLFQNNRFDHVVNFAAESHVDRSISNPDIFLSTNVLGTLNLLEMCKKYGVSRFLQVSTDEVYGSLDEGFATEDFQFNPSSPYSASKASAEHFVNSYATTFGLNTGIVMCSNNYGPRQFPEKLIPVAIKALLDGKKIPIYGSGSNVREWIHVEDCVRGILSVLERGTPRKIYNISSGQFSDNLTLIKKILPLLDQDESAISFIADRKGHDFRYAIDSTRIEQELGWKSLISLESGLKSTVDWYLNNSWAFDV
jgi:dTDP-glucose 4,6-dehydratase